MPDDSFDILDCPMSGPEIEADLERRFSGVARLYGEAALFRFRHAHACVVGIGGVGSWAAEALARTAIGRLTLIDLDMIAESNVNRQIHALGDVFGRPKVDVMAARIRAINPSCEVIAVEDFVDGENVERMLDGEFDVVVDAIDQTRAKVALLAACKRRQIAVVTTGGAGGRTDPTQLVRDDLARTTHDPLLARVRQQLRREFGITGESRTPFGIPAVFSREPMGGEGKSSECGVGLSCTGYGSSVVVTGAFGFAAAGAALELLAGGK